MNLNKARDFYSAYHEGSLDDGLRQAFERALAADAEISAEYRQFVRIMAELKALDTPVKVPADLHLKIRERVDANINAQERKARGAGWFFAWKPIAYGAVATAAIIGVVASFSNRANPNLATGGLGPVVSDSGPTVVVVDGVVRLQFASSKPNTVTVSEVATGRSLLNKVVVRQRIDSPVTNLSESPQVLSIGFAEHYSTMYVALPGSSVALAQEGTGTMLELMAAVAGMYGVPVVANAAGSGAKVDWSLDSPDVIEALREELKSLGLKAEVREGGLVWVSSN
jgi:anti-sigma-K factor RskA